MRRRDKEVGWEIDFSGEKPPTPLLDTINYPVHMKNLSAQVKKNEKQHSWGFCSRWSIDFQTLEKY